MVVRTDIVLPQVHPFVAAEFLADRDRQARGPRRRYGHRNLANERQ